MAELDFSPNEYVKIENKEQFKKIYPFLRSYTKYGVEYEYWIKERGMPSFPLYLEYAQNVTDTTIGYTWFPDDERKIKTFKEAYIE